MIDPGCFSGRKEPHLTSKILVLPTLFPLPSLPPRNATQLPTFNCAHYIHLCVFTTINPGSHVSAALVRAPAHLRPSATAHQRHSLCCHRRRPPTTRRRQCRSQIRVSLHCWRGSHIDPKDPQLQEVYLQELAHDEQGVFVLCCWNHGFGIGCWCKGYCPGCVYLV